MQPEDDSDAPDVAATQDITGAPVTAENLRLAGNALDGRAAAAAADNVIGASVIRPATAISSWFSGTVAPGATQHWFWNNSSLTAAYKVGLSPVGASTTSPCQFQVTRTWDVQQFGGEREFHFFLQNTGAIACGATVLLAAQDRTATWSTGGINPGASQTWTWNNANPLNGSYFVGMSPTGATSTNTCEIQVTRSWYTQLSTGERKFNFTLTNTGAIACQGDVQLALTTAADSSWSNGTVGAGASSSWVWNNANPLTRTYVPGLSPTGATGSNTCQLEVTSTTYQQVIHTDGTAERKFFLTVKNVGTSTCSGTVLLNNLG
jgi:hypothetical protein